MGDDIVYIGGFGILSVLLIWQDMRTMRLSNGVLIALWGLGMGMARVSHLVNDALISTLVLFFLMVAVKGAYARLRGREGMGMGDVKLFAALGPWVSPMLIPFFLIWVGVVGCAWGILLKMKGKKGYYPFAPSILMGCALMHISLILLFIYG